MNCKTPLIAAALGAAAMAMVARVPAGEPQTTSQTTTQTTTTRMVTGSVVRYTPGQTIVIKSSDGRTTTYSIGSAAEVPQQVQVGKVVTISTEPASDGSGMAVVKRIETTSVNTQGQTTTTREKTEMSPSGTTTTTSTTTVSGTVTAILPGQSITIEEPGHQVVTYTIDKESDLPQDVTVGKTVVMKTVRVTGIKLPVVRQVTITTVKSNSE
jgi:hypothetical protein